MSYKGSFVAIITPFTKERRVDEKALINLIEWHIANKTDGLVLAGTTGEGINLSFEERLRVIEISVKAAKKRALIVGGTTTASTKDSFLLTREAKRLGMDAALATVPYYSRPTDEGCFYHFKEIAKAGVDLIVYENPSRTGKSLQLQTFKKLEEISQVKAIKASVGTAENFKKIKEATSLPLFAGDDSIILEALALGACGAISVVGNLIPKQTSEMIQKCLAGKIGEGLLVFQEMQTLIEALGLETNPQMVKYGSHLLKKCMLAYRLPLIEPSKEHKIDLEKAMRSLNLLERVNF